VLKYSPFWAFGTKQLYWMGAVLLSWYGNVYNSILTSVWKDLTLMCIFTYRCCLSNTALCRKVHEWKTLHLVAPRITSLKCCALMCMRYVGTLIYLEQPPPPQGGYTWNQTGRGLLTQRSPWLRSACRKHRQSYMLERWKWCSEGCYVRGSGDWKHLMTVR
jgi:hypothetical protein